MMQSEQNEISLVVSFKGETVFSHGGKWLHPLFELNDFLEGTSYNINELKLTDKIAGKAAAFLIIRMGFRNIHIKLVSEGAMAVFRRFGLNPTYDAMVQSIQCKTEQLVGVNDEPEQVWQMLRRRAGRVAGVGLELTGLRVELDNQTILDGVDLLLKPGEHIFIKGSNGAGKTTLLKAILGLLPRTSGSIKINCLEIDSQEWKKQRSIVGYVNQKQVDSKFPISAKEVVAIGLSAKGHSDAETQHRVEIAMRRTGCFHLANRLFHSLSGGEQQRVSIARCLCQEAQLLLFDEPTSFLDAQSKDELKALIMELWSNEAPTIVIVSHDDQWLEKFNWPVLELENGILCTNC